MNQSTEQKIREAYVLAVERDVFVCNYLSFTAGYMALLNELEQRGYWYKYINAFGDEVWTTDSNWGNRTPLESTPLYRLPEGVNRD